MAPERLANSTRSATRTGSESSENDSMHHSADRENVESATRAGSTAPRLQKQSQPSSCGSSGAPSSGDAPEQAAIKRSWQHAAESKAGEISSFVAVIADGKS